MTRARHRAVLLMLAFAAGQLGTMLHQATALHARCPEHGELVHADAVAVSSDGGGRGLVAWANGLRDDGTSDDIRGMPTAGGHDHDHCYATCASRAGAVDAARAPMVRAPLVARAAPTIDDSERAPGRALYLTAPKTSPPA